MTELLENSDNTNESAVVSESPANEATISLAAVQALADALQKIEAYTPTVWVDNESPDIDAVHLNKAEQAIMRVTTAMNSAVDVIKDLQSQVNTTNNNLSNSLQYVHTAENPFDFNDANTPAGFHRINDYDSFKNPPADIKNVVTLNYGNIFVCRSNKNSDTLSMTFYPSFNNTIFMKTANATSWEGQGWIQFASKSDLLVEDSLLLEQNFTTGVTTTDITDKMATVPSGYERIAAIVYTTQNYLLAQLAYISTGRIYITVDNRHQSDLIYSQIRCVQLIRRK